MSPKPSGMIIWANHLGIIGAMLMGYSISTFTRSQLPIARQPRTKKVVTFATHLPGLTLVSFWKIDSLVSANSLFCFAAKTAPTKPIQSVRCCTRIWDAGMLFILKKRVTVYIIGRAVIVKKMKSAIFSSILTFVMSWSNLKSWPIRQSFIS